MNKTYQNGGMILFVFILGYWLITALISAPVASNYVDVKQVGKYTTECFSREGLSLENQTFCETLFSKKFSKFNNQYCRVPEDQVDKTNADKVCFLQKSQLQQLHRVLKESNPNIQLPDFEKWWGN